LDPAYDGHADCELAILFAVALGSSKQTKSMTSGAFGSPRKQGEMMINPATGGSSRTVQEIKAGWRVILTSAAGCALGYAALIFYTFGLFIDPIVNEFGWTRGEVSSIYSFGSTSVLVIGPLMGWIIDRVGFRVVAAVCIPLFSIMLFVMSCMGGTLWAFRGAFFAMGVVGLGTTPLVYTRIVNERFDKARGLALGLTLVGVGLVAIILPPVVAKLIAASGWRSAFVLLSGLAIIPWIMVLATKGNPKRSLGDGQGRMAYWPALKSSIFWRLGIGFCAIAISVTGLMMHIVSILKDMGVTPATAVGTASLMGFGVIFGRVLTGWLLDRVFAPYLIAVLLLVATVGVLSLAQGGPSFGVVAAMMMGFILGAEVDLIAYLTARYFRIESYSFLFALLYTFFGGGAGPGLLGQIFDYTGSYHMALWTVAGLLLGTAVLFTTFPDYEQRRQQEVSTQLCEVSPAE
jgi:MFS family permease